MSTQDAVPTRYAVHKTAKLAYKQVGAEWQPISPKDVPPDTVVAGHTQIGDRWFTIKSRA